MNIFRDKKMVMIKRIVQTFFLFMFVYVLWSTTYPLTGMIPTNVFFVSDPHIMLLTSIAERVLLPGIAVASVMLLLTFIFGRFFCGWICPLGTLMDITSSFKKKKIIFQEKFSKIIRKIKYVGLFISFVVAILGIQIAWILDPVVLTARFISLSFMPTATLLFNELFIFMIRGLGMYGKVYDIYRTLRSSVLGINVHFFDNTGMIVFFFVTIILSSFFISRIWCKAICPLGAMYGLIAKRSLLARKTTGYIECEKCGSVCRMAAIHNSGNSYTKSECILCMDCLYTCQGQYTKFEFRYPFVRQAKKDHIEAANPTRSKGLSRKEFFFLILSFFTLTAFRKKNIKLPQNAVIRPPGALDENEFTDRCVRCGMCMKVCPTNVVQPAMLEAGPEGIWTPKMVFKIGYCEYNCTLCGQVCPSGALKKLPLVEKKVTKLGIAAVNKEKCIAWAHNEECLVCEEHCPIPNKAIKTDIVNVGGKIIGRPVVDKSMCIGCGICQNKCPIRPDVAISVKPIRY
ncbi:MAG: 4Fe-4S binding protein [Candidatus Aadella gelida]|nr:4Fe-4S binding protein [Candidatus Aadella gelida]